MGLKDFKTAPDNKGGRPKKSESEEEVTGEFYGEPAHKDCDEAWWREQYDEFVAGDEPTTQEITQFSDWVALRPQTLEYYLAIHDIYVSDRAEEMYPAELGLKAPSSPSKTQKKSSSSGGIFSMVEDAK